MAMTRVPGNLAAGDPKAAKCVARSVAKAFSQDPTLEAVTIDRNRQTISVATLGQTNIPEITERIRNTIRNAQEADEKQPCLLLEGEGDCSVCDIPLSESERQKITIRHDAGATTIARVTCPTAPKFWRWRDIPWPKVVQRDVEFLEHVERTDEWKPQLLAAVLCGAFGLGGYFLSPSPWAIGSYLAAYLAGGWYASLEVWELLQQRAIDVHFLMLAVAAGSASIGAWGEGATLLFLFSLSGALEHFALGRTQREIRSLFREAPKFAILIEENGHERQIQVEKLQPGLRLLIKPGEQ